MTFIRSRDLTLSHGEPTAKVGRADADLPV